MYECQKRDGEESQLIVGRGMNHVYPVMPIPDAKKARKKYCEIVMR